ncbi:Ser/Thr protein kinase [Mucor ambiguus]|uniref:non-specific serine/threonine protein kinase n=1 Tax=Mucor ambiguus TaxID=91626 RepID=A0A0C9MPZ8_9FUNG|nr:Ser/Thr protein kinase [Mucor ambiguus]
MESPIKELPHQTHNSNNHHSHHHTTNSNDAHAMMRPRRVIGKFFLSKTLGKGSMGKVAVKIVPRRLTLNNPTPPTKKERDVEISREVRTIREASIMLLLDHPFIARLDEMVLVDNFYYLFMEYVDGGQLLDYIISHGKLKERQARQFARQIASALDYCHRNSIVHRDLKVENILISRSGTIKIIDFGLSNVFSPQSHLSTFCGSLYFAAPELLDGRMYTGPEVDVWSFGVVLYVLVVGQVPFDDPSMAGMHAKVKQGHVEYPGHLSSDCKSLLQRMLVTHRKQRATMSEVIVHPWMNKGYDAPVENYLAKRKPLQLPVDMNVVRGMRGFEFGTEEAIKSELEAIITSEAYQSSAKQVELMSERSFEEVPSSHLLRRRSFSYAMNDPQSMPAAYHPLISIYYLVQERMQRDALAKRHMDQQEYLSDGSSKQEEDTIGVSYSAHGKTHVQQQTAQQEQAVVNQALEVVPRSPGASPDHGRGHRRQISDASATSTLSASTSTSTNGSTNKPNILRRLGRRLSRQHHPEEEEGEANRPMANTRQSRRGSDAVPVIITKQTTLEDAPIVTLNGAPVLAEHHLSSATQCHGSSDDDKLSKKFNNLLKRATSITVKDLPSTKHGTEHKTATAADHFDRRPSTVVERRGPASLSAGQDNEARRHRQDTAASALLTLPTSDPVFTVKEEEHVDLDKKQKADDAVKSVYLKGLFSVATTSNKKASVIRQEIIRILDKKNILYREKKDRFECFMGGDIISDDDDTTDTNKDPLAVRFDIYIVKIPLLWGMRGVRFRRVSGDPWRYKNTCSTILDSLNL